MTSWISLLVGSFLLRMFVVLTVPTHFVKSCTMMHLVWSKLEMELFSAATDLLYLSFLSLGNFSFHSVLKQ